MHYSVEKALLLGNPFLPRHCGTSSSSSICWYSDGRHGYQGQEYTFSGDAIRAFTGHRLRCALLDTACRCPGCATDCESMVYAPVWTKLCRRSQISMQWSCCMPMSVKATDVQRRSLALQDCGCLARSRSHQTVSLAVEQM